MPTLTQTPAVTIPKKECRCVLTLAETGANFVSLWLTAGPKGSDEQNELDELALARKLVYEGGGGAGEPYKWTPSKAGVYTFKAQEYVKGSDYGGGYEGDPNAETVRVLAGTEASLSVYVATKVTQSVGYGADKSTLTLFVQNTLVRQTTIKDHGEVSPRLDGGGTKKAVIAELNCTSEIAALSSITGVAAGTALGSLPTICDDIITKFNAHLTQATRHQNNDTDNTIANTFKSPTTGDTLARSVNEILKKLRQHMLNDDGAGDGPGGADYHNVGGNVGDWANLTLFESISASNMADACGALADIWRAYEAHRVNLSVHDNSDATNTLTALTAPLLLLHKAYVAVIRNPSPTAPSTENAGAVTLIHGAGFLEA